MKRLKEFLNHAKDFQEGDGSTRRVRRYYSQNPEEAERLWENLLEFNHEKEETRSEFLKLLKEKDQLFIQNDVGRTRRDLIRPLFEMRVYPDGGTRIPVLKVTFPAY